MSNKKDLTFYSLLISGLILFILIILHMQDYKDFNKWIFSAIFITMLLALFNKKFLGLLFILGIIGGVLYGTF